MTTTTEADKAETLRRRRARARLTRATTMLEDFEHRLKALHADRSGSFRLLYAPPLIPDEFYVINRGTQRNLREALAGCPEAIAWVADTAELRARVDTLRAARLPERDPNYTGPDVMPTAAQWAGKRSRNLFASYTRRPTAEIVEERMAKVRERQQRGRTLLAEFIAESGEGSPGG